MGASRAVWGLTSPRKRLINQVPARSPVNPGAPFAYISSLMLPLAQDHGD